MALPAAAFYGRLDHVRRLLAVRPKATARQCTKALLFATWTNQEPVVHAQIVRALLADGRADPTVEYSLGLRRAAHCALTDTLEAFLVDGRADPAALDDEALQAAVRLGHVAVVRALLADGRANPQAVSPALCVADTLSAVLGAQRWRRRRQWLRAGTVPTPRRDSG
jgi:hypothetical protein